MRVAIISPTYQPNKSYQENLWAEEFNRQGEEVCVFTAGPFREKNSKKLSSRTELSAYTHQHPCGYQSLAIPTFALPRDIFLSQFLAFALESYQPHLILWFGVGTYFELSFLKSEALKNIVSVCFFSLSRAGRHAFLMDDIYSLSSCIQALGFQFLRTNLYAHAMLRARLVVCNTPEGADILSHLLTGKALAAFEQKHVQLPLAYCAHTFSFSPHVRQSIRAKHSIQEDQILFLYSSRFEEDKKPAIDHYLKRLQALLSQNPLFTGVLIGFTGNQISQSYLIRLKPLIDQRRLLCFPFQSRQALSELYQASDIAYFPQPSISIQEALGTGLWVIHPKDQSIDHLSQYSDRINACSLDELEDYLLMLGGSSILKDQKHRLSSSIKAQALSSHRLRQTLLALIQDQL
jgi:hypothetical protein